MDFNFSRFCLRPPPLVPSVDLAGGNAGGRGHIFRAISLALHNILSRLRPLSFISLNFRFPSFRTVESGIVALFRSLLLLIKLNSIESPPTKQKKISNESNFRGKPSVS